MPARASTPAGALPGACDTLTAPALARASWRFAGQQTTSSADASSAARSAQPDRLEKRSGAAWPREGLGVTASVSAHARKRRSTRRWLPPPSQLLADRLRSELGLKVKTSGGKEGRHGARRAGRSRRGAHRPAAARQPEELAQGLLFLWVSVRPIAVGGCLTALGDAVSEAVGRGPTQQA